MGAYLVPFARLLANQSRTVSNRTVTLVDRASLDTAVSAAQRLVGCGAGADRGGFG